jgi:uncharacterized membrane protein
MLFLLSQHLHWACVGDEIIRNFGGKYYIPIYPLILFAITGLLSKRKFFANNREYVNLYLVIITLIVQIEFLFVMIGRYYD